MDEEQPVPETYDDFGDNAQLAPPPAGVLFDADEAALETPSTSSESSCSDEAPSDALARAEDDHGAEEPMVFDDAQDALDESTSDVDHADAIEDAPCDEVGDELRGPQVDEDPGGSKSKAPEFAISRIKKLMKLDTSGGPVMVSNETAAIVGRTAALFLEDLVRAAVEETKRRDRKTLSYDDIAMVVSQLDRFAFLGDVIPPRRHFNAAPQHRTRHSETQSKRRSAASVDTTKAAPPESQSHSSLKQTTLSFAHSPVMTQSPQNL
jgi:histone H3/H4